MVSDQSQDEAEQQPKIGRIPALIAAVAVVGIAIGAAAGLLTLMLYQVERFALGYIENAHESGLIGARPGQGAHRTDRIAERAIQPGTRANQPDLA